MSKTYSITITNNKLKRKNRLAKKSSKKFPTRLLLGLFIIASVLFTGGYFLRKYATSCEGDNCHPFLRPLMNTIEPKLDQDNGLTNILIVGIDTREDNPGLMNTDTIIVATIDHANKTAVLTSIPRDFWILYTLPNGNYASSKINSAYASGEWHGEGYGITTLQGAVEKIIGEPIHYYVKITLRGFIEAVDTIGGIDIEIPEYYKDAYPYDELPSELQASCKNFFHDGHYCLFEFFEGTEHMDGQRALIYARCRLLSPKGDFDRAARQQRVIDAAKDKVLSSETLLDPTKIWELFNIVQEHVETSTFSINDIRAALNLRNEIDTNEIGRVVLDPYLGNTPGKYIYRPIAFPNRGYYIEARDISYLEIQELLAYIRKYPGIYNEASTISIYNASGNYELETDYVAQIEQDHPLFIFQNTNKIIDNIENQYKGISIYKFTQEAKPATEEYLKHFFGVEEIITDPQDGTQAYLGEDFVIVIGLSESEVTQMDPAL